MQGVGLCSSMLAWVPGYAAAGVIALLSPLYLAVLPILAPVSPFITSCAREPYLTRIPYWHPKRLHPYPWVKMRIVVLLHRSLI